MRWPASKKAPRPKAGAPVDSTLHSPGGMFLIMGTTRGTIFLGFRLVDPEVAALEGGAVKAFDGCIGFRIAGHFNKSKTLGLASLTVFDQVDGSDFTIGGKGVAKVFIRDAIGQISNIDIHLIFLQIISSKSNCFRNGGGAVQSGLLWVSLG